jgi:putative membrane protein
MKSVRRSFRTLSLAAAAALAAGACAAPMTTTATAAGEVAPSATMFSEPSVAATSSASNLYEIQTSQLALERAQSAAVKDFARRMIEHHTRLETQQAALLQQKGLAPMDNAHSAQLKKNLPPTLAMLRQHQGAAFDGMYLVDQIGQHKNTLLTIDTSLLPSTRDPQMQAMLRDQVRPAVVQHLDEAMRLHHQMMAPAAGGMR